MHLWLMIGGALVACCIVLGVFALLLVAASASLRDLDNSQDGE